MRYLHRRIAVAAAVVVASISLTAVVSAQAPPAATAPATPDTFVNWVAGKVNALVAAKKAIADNGNGAANQKESPSNDTASTSLVDTSAASDFVSLALSLTGLQPADASGSKPKSG